MTITRERTKAARTAEMFRIVGDHCATYELAPISMSFDVLGDPKLQFHQGGLPGYLRAVRSINASTVAVDVTAGGYYHLEATGHINDIRTTVLLVLTDDSDDFFRLVDADAAGVTTPDQLADIARQGDR